MVTPSTPRPQPILVLRPPSSGHTTHCPCHRSVRPSSSRKIPPTHPDPRHPNLPSKPQSPRPRSTLPSILQDHPPPAPPNRLRAKESKIPAPTIPHDCRFCPEVTDRIFCHRRPFEYVLATPRSRGRPRRDTGPPISSTEDSDSDSV
jgi:hypothetical protein